MKTKNKQGYFTYNKKELKEFQDAYNEGKLIQIKYVFSIFANSKSEYYWKDISGKPNFSKKSLHELRIKPEDDKNGHRTTDDIKKNGRD